MRYASACDGIGAVHVAWKSLGWECAWVSEIDQYPSAVVDHHFGYDNIGDMTQITQEMVDERGSINLLVGGTPCQSFSVAGLRRGLDDPRGNLALVFLGLADKARPEWVVWENVPGVLSSSGGRDFGAFLGALVQLGYGFAYRVLDAQFFGVPQRRRRVFVVGHLGGWQRAAAVLFERESLCGNPSPPERLGVKGGETVGTLTTRTGIANDNYAAEVGHCVIDGGRPRWVTPRECERLQGFPDDYTLVEYNSKPAADTPRYKALGNSMAVPVMAWIGERIQAVAEVAP